jgi:hypothetical protein
MVLTPNLVKSTHPNISFVKRAMVALADASDACGDAILCVMDDQKKALKRLDSACNNLREQVVNKKRYRSLDAAFEDTSLGGGGYKKLKKMHRVLHYCDCRKKKYGMMDCGKLLQSISTHCDCGHRTCHQVGGEPEREPSSSDDRVYHNVDHVSGGKYLQVLNCKYLQV